MKEYELERGIHKTILSLLEFNFEVDSTSHYKELTALWYPMYITMKHQVFGFVTYYPLYIIS